MSAVRSLPAPRAVFPTPNEARASYESACRTLAEAFHEPGIARDPRWLRACDRFDKFVRSQPFVQLGAAIADFVERRDRDRLRGGAP